MERKMCGKVTYITPTPPPAGARLGFPLSAVFRTRRHDHLFSASSSDV